MHDDVTQETLAILAQSMPPRDELLQSLGCGTADTTIDSTTYRQLYIKFADHLFESVHGAFHALAELRYVTDLLFPKFLAPVVNDGVAPTEVARLFSHIGPYLKGMLNKIYLRAVSSAEFEVGQSAIAIDQSM